MKLIDNVSEILREDLKRELNKDTKISIVAAGFSIYAFRELMKELEQVKELNFVFNQEMFTGVKNPAESDLYGTEFETRLRNDLMQQKLAKECADWIREKVRFRSNISGMEMPGFINAGDVTYFEIKKVTTVDLGVRKGSMTYYPMSSMQLRLIEDAKIHCAREHFKAISGDNVVYDVVDSYTSLMEKVMK